MVSIGECFSFRYLKMPIGNKPLRRFNHNRIGIDTRDVQPSSSKGFCKHATADANIQDAGCIHILQADIYHLLCV